MYKKLYQKFIEVNPGVQHYACHSHHYWPDVTFEAVQQCWLDSAKFVDGKWDHFFGTKLPQAQKLISEHLNIATPEQIVFASNTHEFVTRILSCLPIKKKVRVLTTDSEFYSFDRQINRFAEEEDFEVEKVAVEPFSSFEERFLKEAVTGNYDLVFFSHVFFNSGYVFNGYEKVLAAVQNSDALVVMDGYHGFMAIPTDLASVASRFFYLAGSYKYAQGGEGACFMYVPESARALRPRNTGWFAGFADLVAYNSNQKKITYSKDGFQFAGATLDFTAIYRLVATLELFKKEGINVQMIHHFVKKNQKKFLEDIQNIEHPIFKSYICRKNLLMADPECHGHFLTFDLKDAKSTQEVSKELTQRRIITDSRGSRLRFGFGLYQDPLNWPG